MTQAQAGRIVTPEAVPLEFELASIGSRSFAILIDWAIQGAGLFAVLFGFGIASDAVDAKGWIAATGYVLIFLVFFGYPIAMETFWRGRSVGKAAFGLRVVTKEGAPERFRHAAIRAALGIVDFAITFGAGAILSVLFTRDNQRLGDIVAGTVVLRERTGNRTPAPVTFPVPPGLEQYVATIDTSGLSPDDYGAVRAFLLRAPSLPPHVRAELSLTLAGPLRDKLRTTPPDGVPPDLFLLCVAAAHQRRQATAAPSPAWAPPAAPAEAPTVAVQPVEPPPASATGFTPPH